MPPSNFKGYTLAQKAVFNRLAQVAPDISQKFSECKGRAQQRQMINSLVPSDVNYACRINVDSANAWMKQITTRTRSANEEMQAHGRTEASIVADWGRGDLDKGLTLFKWAVDKGDLVEDDGLYYSKSNTKKSARSYEDRNEATVLDNVADKAKMMTGMQGVGNSMNDAWLTWGTDALAVRKQGKTGLGSSAASATTATLKSMKTADSTALTHLRSAYEKCSVEVRKAKRVTRGLQQVIIL